MTRSIAFNLETSGLDPLAGSEIIKICALELLDNAQIGASFATLIKPVRPLTGLVEELTGISKEMLANAPSFADIGPYFMAFAGDDRLICINASFDRAFLNDVLVSVGLPTLQPERFLDLWELLPSDLRQHGSDVIYSYAGIERKPTEPASHEIARIYWALSQR